MIKARVTVTLKNGVLDPQGKAIEGALGALGFDGIGQVRRARSSICSSKPPTRPRLKPTSRPCAKSLLANHRYRKLQHLPRLTAGAAIALR
ncbi:phosphoribosylformylglycinamidine synthase [Sinorhizobium meliloti]|nr:phosphoribosylformylglycinamidine synthase [Sinorhizobium meliloti]